VKNSLLKNGFYNILAGAIRIGLFVLTIPVLIRLMGIEAYGVWTLAYSVLGMVTLAEAGLSVATTVFVSQDLRKEETDSLSKTLTITFGAILILSTFSLFAIYFSAQPIVSLFPKIDQAQKLVLMQALQIGGIVVWVQLIQRTLVGVEQAYQSYGLINLLSTIQSMLLSLGMLVVASLGGRTVALMQWQAVASFIVLLGHVWLVRHLTRDIKLHIRWEQKRSLEIAKYSLLTWFSSLGGMLFLRGDRLIVGALLGSTTLGIYATVTDITGQINYFSALPVQPLLPTLSGINTKLDIYKDKIQQQIKQAVVINIVIALGLGTILFTLAPLVMQLMLGNTVDHENILGFRIATIIYSLYSLNAVGYYVLFSINEVKKSLLISLSSGTLALILIAIGASRFGLIGAMLGNAGYLGVWLLTFFSMKYLNIKIKTWATWFQFPVICFLAFNLIAFFVVK
jgi:O-antigen/teichoic acid export membrane protein